MSLISTTRVTLIDDVVNRFTEFNSFEELLSHYYQNKDETQLVLNLKGFTITDQDCADIISFEALFYTLMNEDKRRVLVGVQCTEQQYAMLKEMDNEDIKLELV
jgi:hypothetical protein